MSMTPSHPVQRYDGRAGFTVAELSVAAGVSVLVGVAVLSCFVWCVEQTTLCSKIAWSQDKAMRTCGKVTAYIRNSKEIVDIDQIEGTWVRLRMPDNSIVKLAYSNAIPLVREGRMLLQLTNANEVIVSRGLSEVMDSDGFTMPVFTRVSTNTLRVSFRVAEPVSSGVRAVNDSEFAASVQFSAALRNFQRSN